MQRIIPPHVPSAYLVDSAAGAVFFLHENGEDGLYLALLDDNDRPRWSTIRSAFDSGMDDAERRVCHRAFRALLEYGGLAQLATHRERPRRSA
jgi:hypothetical protein